MCVTCGGRQYPGLLGGHQNSYHKGGATSGSKDMCSSKQHRLPPHRRQKPVTSAPTLLNIMGQRDWKVQVVLQFLLIISLRLLLQYCFLLTISLNSSVSTGPVFLFSLVGGLGLWSGCFFMSIYSVVVLSLLTSLLCMDFGV